MGIIKRGILGGFSNKVGNIIGQGWRGIDVIRAMPISVANPKTSKQVSVRTKFAKAVEETLNFGASVYVPLFRALAKKKTAYNCLVSNIYKATEMIGDVAVVSYGDIFTFTQIGDTSYTLSSSMQVTALLENASGYLYEESANLHPFIVAYDEDKGESYVNTASCTFADLATEQVIGTLPSGWAGDTIDVWAFSIREEDNKVLCQLNYQSL